MRRLLFLFSFFLAMTFLPACGSVEIGSVSTSNFVKVTTDKGNEFSCKVFNTFTNKENLEKVSNNEAACKGIVKQDGVVYDCTVSVGVLKDILNNKKATISVQETCTVMVDLTNK